MTASPLARQLVDDVVEFAFGADVDALGGLVEHDDLGLGQQPAGEEHLLLVATGQGGHRLVVGAGAQSQTVQELVGLGGLLLSRQQPFAGAVAQAGHGDVFSDRQFRQQPEDLAILGEQRHPGAHHAARAVGFDRLAVNLDLTLDDGFGSEDGQQQFAASGAEKASDTQDFAGTRVEIHGGTVREFAVDPGH